MSRCTVVGCGFSPNSCLLDSILEFRVRVRGTTNAMKPDAMKPALFRVHNFRYSNRVRLVDSSKDAHRFVLLKIEKSKITLFHSSLLQPPRHNGRRFQLTGLAGAKNSPLAMYQ